MPLYSRGDDANAKQFRSLHAVQRHMVDSNQCRMVYDDNEEEYADFYDYGGDDEVAEGGAWLFLFRRGPRCDPSLVHRAGKDLVLADAPAPAMVVAGYELALPAADGGTKVLGAREFARYYRQKHRPEDQRQSVIVNTMLARLMHRRDLSRSVTLVSL